MERVMGLVVPDDVITDVQPLGTNVPVAQFTKVCTGGSSSSDINDELSIDKTLYTVLSMQDDMKTITVPTRVRNEFEQFLKYGEDKQAGREYPIEFDQLDEYIGALGTGREICK